jgi:hypothetical protein
MKYKDLLANRYAGQYGEDFVLVALRNAYLAGFDEAKKMIAKSYTGFTMQHHMIHGLVMGEKTHTISGPYPMSTSILEHGEEEVEV